MKGLSFRALTMYVDNHEYTLIGEIHLGTRPGASFSFAEAWGFSHYDQIATNTFLLKYCFPLKGIYQAVEMAQ